MTVTRDSASAYPASNKRLYVGSAFATVGVATVGLLGYYYLRMSPPTSPNSTAPPITLHYHRTSYISGSPGISQLQAVEAGPASTSLRVLTYGTSTGASCVTVTESAGPGPSIIPGKPARPIQNCGRGNINPGLLPHPSVPPAFGVIFDDEGGLWVSPTGQRYMLQFGRVASRVSKVSITSANGHTLIGEVSHGWWAIAVPYADVVAGFNQTFISKSGSVLGQLSPHGAFCPAGQKGNACRV